MRSLTYLKNHGRPRGKKKISGKRGKEQSFFVEKISDMQGDPSLKKSELWSWKHGLVLEGKKENFFRGKKESQARLKIFKKNSLEFLQINSNYV